eukprot:COSAG01_NODE_39945_length_469_cov_37.532432_1_plen_73_part_01
MHQEKDRGRRAVSAQMSAVSHCFVRHRRANEEQKHIRLVCPAEVAACEANSACKEEFLRNMYQHQPEAPSPLL